MMQRAVQSALVSLFLALVAALFAASAAFAAEDGQGALVAEEPASPAVEIGQARVSSVKSPSWGKVLVKAGAVANATGYEFQVGTGAKMAKVVKSAKGAGRTQSFKGLKQGGKYYVRVRAYAVSGTETVWGAWSAAKAVKVKWKPAWKTKGGYVYYRMDDGKNAKGLVKVKGKTYYFDGKGRQKTGWQNVKGSYRHFKSANKAKGYMDVKRVVNGIKLGKRGVAKITASGREELSIMCKAQKLLEKLTKPTQSKKAKLSRCFDYLQYECVESLTRTFSNYPNWHRAFALDVFNHKTGSCYSYGAALSYLANEIGYGRCVIVSSGGHGWAEIDGLVYDAEWSRWSNRRLYGISYGESGRNGVLPYSTNRVYTAQISPRSSRW